MALKLTHSGPGGHQYHQVPLHSESESDDDTPIYAAKSLNNHQSDTLSFGMGYYDHSNDLDLPPIVQLPSKKEQFFQRRYNQLRPVFSLCIMIIIMVIMVAIVTFFLVLVNTGYFTSSALSSSSSNSDPSCFPVPTPLLNSRIQPCVTTSAATTHFNTQSIQPSTDSGDNIVGGVTTPTQQRTDARPSGEGHKDEGTPPVPQPTQASEQPAGPGQDTTTTSQPQSTSPDHQDTPPSTHPSDHKDTPPSDQQDTPPTTQPPNHQDTPPSTHTPDHNDTPPSTHPPDHKDKPPSDQQDTPPTTQPPDQQDTPPTTQPPNHQDTPPSTHPPDHKDTPPSDQQDTPPTTQPPDHQDTPPTAHPPDENATPPTPEQPSKENPTEKVAPVVHPITPTNTKQDVNTETSPTGSFPQSIPPVFPEETCYPVPKPLPSSQLKPCVPVVKVTTEVTGQSSPTTTDIVKTSSVATTTTPEKDTETESPGKDAAASKSNEPTASTTPPPPPTSNQDPHLHWEREIKPAMSETSTQLYDANKDGVNDILSVVDVTPCQGKVLALNGLDGSTIWERAINFPAFAIRCVLDVNSDGSLDCLVSGRIGGFVALDGKDGTVLWYVDPSIVFAPYNFYFPLVLADMNNDGVDDIVNIHGGDSKYKPAQHDRSPAFLVAISGKTGQKLMEPILMPDGRESYFSPVLFAMNSSSEFLLFGSGGETVPGSLWAVELNSLRMRVMLYHTRLITGGQTYQINHISPDACMFRAGAISGELRPVYNASMFDLTETMSVTSLGHLECPTWADKHPLRNEYDVCLYEVLRGSSKGVILSPVMVDMTRDGVLDLVVSSYDGVTTVLDGRDMSTVMWQADYSGTESYSLPAPIFYTTDNIPDLVIRTNIGAWPDYNVSTVRVLDGSDGSLLWTFNSTHSGMMSTVSVISDTHGRDALLFVALGVEGEREEGEGMEGEGEKVEGQGGDSDKRRSKRKESRPMDNLIPDSAEASEGEGRRSPRHASAEDTVLDPPDLWVSTPDDPVPDPKDIDAVLKYCGMTKASRTATVYMVTREMIESGMDVVPLASYEPFVFLRDVTTTTSRTKRQDNNDQSIIDTQDDHPHSNSNNPGDDDHPHSDVELPDAQLEADADADPHRIGPVGLRCSHVSSPTSIYTTPLLGDFNNDGRLDVNYVIVWGSGYEGAFKTLLVTSDLERLFVGAYGKEILDFERFLSPAEQPWTQYMGQKGDNVFMLPKS